MIGVTTGIGPGSMGLRGLIACSANLPDRVASAVDLQLDDGTSAGGALRARQQTAPNQGVAAAAVQYLEDGSVYLLCKSL